MFPALSWPHITMAEWQNHYLSCRLSVSLLMPHTDLHLEHSCNDALKTVVNQALVIDGEYVRSMTLKWMCVPVAVDVPWPGTVAQVCHLHGWCRSSHWCYPPSPHTPGQSEQSGRSQELREREDARLGRVLAQNCPSSSQECFQN